MLTSSSAKAKSLPRLFILVDGCFLSHQEGLQARGTYASSLPQAWFMVYQIINMLCQVYAAPLIYVWLEFVVCTGLIANDKLCRGRIPLHLVTSNPSSPVQ